MGEVGRDGMDGGWMGMEGGDNDMEEGKNRGFHAGQASILQPSHTLRLYLELSLALYCSQDAVDGT